MNEVKLSGGLVRDPEFTYLQSGAPVWEATVAVSDAMYSANEGGQVVRTTYVAVQAWGETAKRFASENYGKGDEVYVVGMLTQHETTKQDGTKERKTKVRPLVLLPVKRRNTQQSQQRPAPAQQQPYDTGWGSAEPPF